MISWEGGSQTARGKWIPRKRTVQVCGNLSLKSIPIRKQLLLVVQQLLPRLGRKFLVLCWKMKYSAEVHGRSTRSRHTLDDGVNGASLLTEPTVDTFGHVDV